MGTIEMTCDMGHPLYGVQDVRCQTCDVERIRALEAALTTIADGKYRGVLSDFCRAALSSAPKTESA